MTDEMRWGIVACLVLLAIILLLLLVRNARKSKVRKQLDEINVRFNKVQTIPLTFKLNKAKVMAKIDEATVQEVDRYYLKYEEAQKHLDQLQDLINGAEDSLAGRKYKDAQRALTVIEETLKDSEEEVNEIDRFLDRFAAQENEQRNYSNALKERFRDLKNKILDHESELAYSMDGLNERLGKCEELFSSSEEWMYGNEYGKAQEDLREIEQEIASIDASVDVLPQLEEDARGTIPVLADEFKRQYELSNQRGLYLGHLNIDETLCKNDELLKGDLKTLLSGRSTGVAEDLETLKESYNTLLSTLKKENAAFKDLGKAADAVEKEINDFEKIEVYLETVYNNEKERYNLEELANILPKEKDNIARFRHYFAELKDKMTANKDSAYALLNEAGKMFEAIRTDKEYLRSIKGKVDNTSNGEARAITQVMKLQVVLNEVEVKIAQYRLPAISSSYKDDLKIGHDYVRQIKDLLAEVPLRIDVLNQVLEEAIDFIYKLYNNVNNVVGMALMVENTIVFGNKYRSTYPEIDRELSRAEFSYLNGEYTQALKTALSCMETLFPNTVDDRILENAKSAR